MRTARRTAVILAAAGLAAAPAAAATERTLLDVEPGPTVMSEEERALVPDPGRGLQHAVILIEETQRNEAPVTYSEFSFHLRAKVLSSEGRAIGNVTIPFNRQEGILRAWWGRTILPDGSVLELKAGDLEEQVVARSSGRSYRVLRGALQGVAPGCVIDYGYVYRWPRIIRWGRVPLQRLWPVRQFRYRWVPSGDVTSSYAVERAGGIDVEVVRDARALLITAKDVPALIPEPWMPPEVEVGAIVYLSTARTGVNAADFWKRQAARLDRRVSDFAGKPETESLLSRMALPEGADLKTKLRLAYEWIGANLKDTSAGQDSPLDVPDDLEDEARLSKEEKEAARRTAREVLEEMEGTDLELDLLYAGVARALGASAHLVLATDRRESYWTESLMTLDQFDESLVAVWERGKPGEKETLVDPGSGLPFGEIPWWLTGVRGFMATPESARRVMLAPSEARRNVAEAKVAVAFDAEGGARRARWSWSGTGQQGFRDRWRLRGLGLAEREREVDELCGAGAGVDVARAEAKGVDDLSAPFRIECEGEILEGGPDSPISEFRLPLDGPWTAPVPDLASEARAHPVVFPYPRVDVTSMDVEAPPGFVAREAPPPVSLGGPFGRYVLSVTRTETGFHVERVFSLSPLGVPASEYPALREFLAGARTADRKPLEFSRSKETTP